MDYNKLMTLKKTDKAIDSKLIENFFKANKDINFFQLMDITLTL